MLSACKAMTEVALGSSGGREVAIMAVVHDFSLRWDRLRMGPLPPTEFNPRVMLTSLATDPAHICKICIMASHLFGFTYRDARTVCWRSEAASDAEQVEQG